MSKTRLRKPPGWKMSMSTLSPFVVNIETRQQLRAKARGLLWEANSGTAALTDEHGIIPRRVRRSISAAQFQRAKENMVKWGGVTHVN